MNRSTRSEVRYAFDRAAPRSARAAVGAAAPAPARAARSGLAALAFAALIASLSGCSLVTQWIGEGDGKTESPAYQRRLYMTDTMSGRVYTFDPSTGASSSSALLTTRAAAGAIVFHGGIAYAAVGQSFSGNNDAGLYRFDPGAAVPAASRIGGADLGAQNVAFDSANLGWLTVAGSTNPTDDGLYYFDAALASPTLTQVTGTSNLYLQQVVVGGDGYVYVAQQDYYTAATPAHNVLKVDRSSKTIAATFATSQPGTTALSTGSLNGVAGIFVGNVSFSGGSVDFVNTSGAAQSLSNVLDIPAYRLLAAPSGALAVTNYANSYLITFAGAVPSATELKRGGSAGSSFGASDIALAGESFYFAYTDYSTTNALYVFDLSGAERSYSPVSIMRSGDAVAGLAFYQ